MDTKDTKKEQQNAQNYTCVFCHVICNKKHNYDKHLSTRKHENMEKRYKKIQNDTKKEQQNAINLHSCNCGN
jgi:hypothetical protein